MDIKNTFTQYFNFKKQLFKVLTKLLLSVLNMNDSSVLSASSHRDPHVSHNMNRIENNESISDSRTPSETFNIGNENFEIELFEIGDRYMCLYSLFCPCCAIAESRTKLDGSSYWFNCCCLPLAPYRWLVRSAYHIGDMNRCTEDLVLSMCCPCFVINQIYQTTMIKGNPSSDGGKMFNINHFSTHSNNLCDDVCSACFLQPCMIGSVVNHAVGMPYLLACLCMNVCTARNIIRYQYRIKPTYDYEDKDELIMPITSCIGGLLLCTPFLSPIYALSIATQIYKESKFRTKLKNKRYLLGYRVEYEDAELIEDIGSMYGGMASPQSFTNESPFSGNAVLTIERVEPVNDVREYVSMYSNVTNLTNEDITVPSPAPRRSSTGRIKYVIKEVDVHVAEDVD